MTNHTSASKDLPVALTGATGFVGRSVLAALTSKGFKVRALVRSADRAYDRLGAPSALAAKGVELVVGDAADPAAADQLLRNTRACINLVGIIREVRGQSRRDPPQTFERMHVAAARVLVHAAENAGVKRFIQMSALGVGPEGRSLYQKSKWDAEQLIRRSSLDWTIFRPSLILGPGSELLQMMTQLGSGAMPPYFFLPYFVRQEFDQRLPWPLGPSRMVPAKVQPVHVEDVALAFVSALSNPVCVAEVYNLVGPDILDWQQLTETIRDRLPGMNPKMGTWFVPGEHAALIALAAAKVGLGSLLPFDPGQALMAIEDNTADFAKAQHDLGLNPRSALDALPSFALA